MVLVYLCAVNVCVARFLGPKLAEFRWYSRFPATPNMTVLVTMVPLLSPSY